MGTETDHQLDHLFSLDQYIKIIKTPHGDGNSILLDRTRAMILLKSLKPRMGTETISYSYQDTSFLSLN